MNRDLRALLFCVGSILFIETAGNRDFALVQPWAQWWHLIWWVGSCVLAFAVAPCLWMESRGENWRALWKAPKVSAHLWLYPAMYLFMVPLLWSRATDPRFQAVYPFFKYGRQFPLLGLGWELAYALVFISLEFFFRGFLIQQWRPRWGGLAILFSAVPYFCIHYRKPLPELLGSFPAGLALGLLSYRTGSIWGGVFCHLAVAYTMDGLQLFR